MRYQLRRSGPGFISIAGLLFFFPNFFGIFREGGCNNPRFRVPNRAFWLASALHLHGTVFICFTCGLSNLN